jgi:hypothetical protein
MERLDSILRYRDILNRHWYNMFKREKNYRSSLVGKGRRRRTCFSINPF